MAVTWVVIAKTPEEEEKTRGTEKEDREADENLLVFFSLGMLVKCVNMLSLFNLY